MTSPYMTTRELAERLQYQGRHQLRSVYKFIARTGVRTSRRGLNGGLLVRREDVARVLGERRDDVPVLRAV